MIIEVKTRDDRGRWVNTSHGQFAEAALRHILSQGCNWTPDAWGWVIWCLSKFCLQKALDSSGNPVASDKWIRRYQTIRGID